MFQQMAKIFNQRGESWRKYLVMDHGKTRQETSEEEANIILNNLQNHGRDIWGLWGPPTKMFLLKVERGERDF